MLHLETLNCSGNEKGLWFSLTSSDMEVQTLWNSLMYAADSSTFHFHAFRAWTCKAGSWLMSNNSSWMRGTGFYSCNKHLVEIFCKGMAFRNKRLNCILSVLETQMRYQCRCLTPCLAVFLVGRGVVLSQFIQCSTPFCTVGSQLSMVDFLDSEISQEMN